MVKLDLKFEIKIQKALELFAIRNETKNENDDKYDNKKSDEESDEDSDEESDEESDDESYKENKKENKIDDDLIHNKLSKKYYFYYKILDCSEISEDIEDDYNNEIDNLEKVITSNNENENDNETQILGNIIAIISNQDKKKKSGKCIAVIYIYDEKLCKILQEVCEISSLFEPMPYITLMSLMYCINNIRIYLEKQIENTDKQTNIVNVMEKMQKFIENIFNDNITKMDNMIANGIIDFESLWYKFDKPGQIYLIKHYNNEERICVRHKSFNYDRNDSIKYFYMNGEIITLHKKKLYISALSHSIKKFKGTKQIKSFDILSISNDHKYNEHIQFGKQILNIHDKIYHMNLKGKQFLQKRNDVISFIRNERVMVDQEGGETMGFDIPYSFGRNESIEHENMTSEDYSIVYPFIIIYNLGTSKTWGTAHVCNLSQIVYNKDAFDYLVLDKKKKNIIMGLIHNYRDGFEDFITNKGNGLIFLLYGPPGVGKTLSSEATCEMLERPLYNVSVGDLGTNPETMETYLNQLNEYVKRWNAIILIDEVDIFLENRECSDITRNAMVCIFLKFLEYHESILFLTTNRLKSIDPAIKSRINLFLAYNQLDQKMRKQVWKSLIDKGKILETISEGTLNELSEFKINGREIRNYLKLVMSIHKQYKIMMTEKTFIKTLKECFELTNEFDEKVFNQMYL